MPSWTHATVWRKGGKKKWRRKGGGESRGIGKKRSYEGGKGERSGGEGRAQEVVKEVEKEEGKKGRIYPYDGFSGGDKDEREVRWWRNERSRGRRMRASG